MPTASQNMLIPFRESISLGKSILPSFPLSQLPQEITMTSPGSLGHCGLAHIFVFLHKLNALPGFFHVVLVGDPSMPWTSGKRSRKPPMEAQFSAPQSWSPGYCPSLTWVFPLGCEGRAGGIAGDGGEQEMEGNEKTKRKFNHRVPESCVCFIEHAVNCMFTY